MENYDVISPANILSLFDTNKAERERFAQQVIDSAVSQGLRDPLEMQVQLKCMEDIIKRIISDESFKAAVISEAAKHGSKSFEFHNSTIQLKDVSRWKYDLTGDTKLAQLEKQKEMIDAEIKARQKFLQVIPAEGVADPETGEMIYPARKEGGETIAVTLK